MVIDKSSPGNDASPPRSVDGAASPPAPQHRDAMPAESASFEVLLQKSQQRRRAAEAARHNLPQPARAAALREYLGSRPTGMTDAMQRAWTRYMADRPRLVEQHGGRVVLIGQDGDYHLTEPQRRADIASQARFCRTGGGLRVVVGDELCWN